MISFYFFSFTVSLFYFILKKRLFDLFTIAFVCALFYASPLLFGEIYDPVLSDFIEIHNYVYLFYGLLFLFLFLFFGAIVNDYKIVYLQENKQSKNNSEFLIMVTFVFTLLFLMFLQNPAFLVETGKYKSDVTQFGPLFSFFVWGSLMLVPIAYSTRNKLKLSVAFALIIISLFAGSRSYFATALLIFFLLFFQENGSQRLIKQYKMIILGLVAFLFLFTFKIFYQFIKVFDFNGAVEVLADNSQYMYRIFQGGEANLIMVNFNNIVTINQEVNLEYFYGLVLKFIPFLSNVYGEVLNTEVQRFSQTLDTLFYSSINYGMGASFWAEMFYIGGWVTLFVSLILFILLLYLGNKLIQKKTTFSLFLIPFFIYTAFYIHRIELAFINYSLFIGLFLYMMTLIMKKLLINKNLKGCRL